MVEGVCGGGCDLTQFLEEYDVGFEVLDVVGEMLGVPVTYVQ